MKSHTSDMSNRDRICFLDRSGALEYSENSPVFGKQGDDYFYIAHTSERECSDTVVDLKIGNSSLSTGEDAQSVN